MEVRRVYFSEGDGSGWAIDEDLRLVRSALEGRFEPSSLASRKSSMPSGGTSFCHFPERRFGGSMSFATRTMPPSITPRSRSSSRCASR